MLTNPPVPYGPSRGLLLEYEPSDGTFWSTSVMTNVTRPLRWWCSWWLEINTRYHPGGSWAQQSVGSFQLDPSPTVTINTSNQPILATIDRHTRKYLNTFQQYNLLVKATRNTINILSIFHFACSFSIYYHLSQYSVATHELMIM